jgi:putative FmdB family regulatory protein
VPIYEYICSACQHRTDILHGINDEGPAFCPNCGAEGTMRKAFAAPAIHFKGTGWAKKERNSASASRSTSSTSDKTDGSSQDGGAGDGKAKTEPAKSTTTTSSDSGD